MTSAPCRSHLIYNESLLPCRELAPQPTFTNDRIEVFGWVVIEAVPVTYTIGTMHGPRQRAGELIVSKLT